MNTTRTPVPAEPPTYNDGRTINVTDRIRVDDFAGPTGVIECIRWNGWVDEWWIHVDTSSSRCIRPFEIVERLA